MPCRNGFLSFSCFLFLFNYLFIYSLSRSSSFLGIGDTFEVFEERNARLSMIVSRVLDAKIVKAIEEHSYSITVRIIRSWVPCGKSTENRVSSRESRGSSCGHFCSWSFGSSGAEMNVPLRGKIENCCPSEPAATGSRSISPPRSIFRIDIRRKHRNYTVRNLPLWLNCSENR